MGDTRGPGEQLPDRVTSRQPWRVRAACRGTSPALFYDPHPAAVASAKRVCAACPVLLRCAAHAIATGEEYGVWGGLAEDERPQPPPAGRPGPRARVSDDELWDLFTAADPERPARDHLLERIPLPSATAYKYLARAQRLGVVEQRGRGLFPVRR
jgi:WhiB family transcriptional regulator, redox-sensing transcriptional regulator